MRAEEFVCLGWLLIYRINAFNEHYRQDGRKVGTGNYIAKN